MIKIAASMLLASCAVLLGQSAPAQTFEVASVKPSDPNARGGGIGFPNGTFTATGITARNCILLAYDIPTFQLAGGPSWIGDQRYDIVAKMAAGAVKAAGPERWAQMRVALQALLADRFQLVIHRETRMAPAYALVVAKSGFKLKKTADDGQADFSSNRGKFAAHKISMELLARNLSGILISPVVDTTGIKGVFDLTLEWSPDEVQSPVKAGGEVSEAAEPGAPAGPSIFTAVQEQLGLKLETQKAPVEMFVIDRIEKPTAN
jgi:bla regulator protein BlaR1